MVEKNQRRRQRNECRHPKKRKYTRSAARSAVAALRAKGWRVSHYRCPSKGHWHLTSARRERR